MTSVINPPAQNVEMSHQWRLRFFDVSVNRRNFWRLPSEGSIRYENNAKYWTTIFILGTIFCVFNIHLFLIAVLHRKAGGTLSRPSSKLVIRMSREKEPTVAAIESAAKTSRHYWQNSGNWRTSGRLHRLILKWIKDHGISVCIDDQGGRGVCLQDSALTSCLAAHFTFSSAEYKKFLPLQGVNFKRLMSYRTTSFGAR